MNYSFFALNMFSVLLDKNKTIDNNFKWYNLNLGSQTLRTTKYSFNTVHTTCKDSFHSEPGNCPLTPKSKPLWAKHGWLLCHVVICAAVVTAHLNPWFTSYQSDGRGSPHRGHGDITRWRQY